MPTIGLNIFADNWTWYATDGNLHGPMATHTVRLVQAFGMTIDWNKSWMWAATKQSIQQLRQALQPHVGEMQLKELLHAMDLGAQMTYRGPARLGRYKDRMAEATKRLKAIQKLPYTLTTKAHLIMTAVYPQVFFGIEVYQ